METLTAKLSALRGQMRYCNFDPLKVTEKQFYAFCDDYLGRTVKDDWYLNCTDKQFKRFYNMFKKWQKENIK